MERYIGVVYVRETLVCPLHIKAGAARKLLRLMIE